MINRLTRSIGIVTYIRLTLRFAALVISLASLVVASCWPFSVPMIATSAGHCMISGHVFIQYLFLKGTPNQQTLQDLSTAKTGENINTVLQTTLGLYFYANYLMKDPPFNKTRCTMIDPNKSEAVLQFVMIAFAVVQILDCIVFIVQYRFILSLRAKYKEEKSRRVEKSESIKPLPVINESYKQAEPPSPNPAPINSTPTKQSDNSVTGEGDKLPVKEKEPLLVAAKIPIDQVKSKPKEMSSNPSCPSTMSFNEKDIGNLKEIEKELVDLLKNNEDPHSAKPAAKQPEPKKPPKARKKMSEPEPVVVDLLDKTQMASESEGVRTQKTQASQTKTRTTTKTTKTSTNTRATRTGNKSSESKVSI